MSAMGPSGSGLHPWNLGYLFGWLRVFFIASSPIGNPILFFWIHSANSLLGTNPWSHRYISIAILRWIWVHQFQTCSMSMRFPGKSLKSPDEKRQGGWAESPIPRWLKLNPEKPPNGCVIWYPNIAKLEHHHFSWENPLFLWSFSIAILT